MIPCEGGREVKEGERGKEGGGERGRKEREGERGEGREGEREGEKEREIS